MKLRFYFKRIIRRRVKRKTPGRKDFLELKEKARLLVKSRLDFWNLHYKFSYGRISIRNQRSRWGSCSSKGNLNFNFRIVTLAPHLTDYIIVHELCHIKQFNHSENFWNLVKETIPNCIELQKELKKIKFKPRG
ncbi:M48 family metallopeptidase [Patescibacteria group bacterium]|nr:M48 family metallopeptidase [Patescibacteria group bacterium]